MTEDWPSWLFALIVGWIIVDMLFDDHSDIREIKGEFSADTRARLDNQNPPPKKKT